MSKSTKNSNLSNAKKAKNDEFYTQYHDIEKEMNAYLDFDNNVFRGKTILLPCDDPEWSNFTLYFAQNFSRLGLKKLISTSFAHQSKNLKTPYQPSLFESEHALFDAVKSNQQGKIFTLTKDINQDGIVDLKDLEWQYLTGDGDFRSDEIKKLRDEADIIITNPPFSLFREFLAWIVEADKKFAIIGNMNAITYKETFSLIKNNQSWLGATNFNKGMYFCVPDNFVYANSYKFEREQNGKKVNRVPGVCWFTNLEHGRRHQPLQLMTMEDNLKFNKKIAKEPYIYQKYENYNAIEIPITNAIPDNYLGHMGVPITFLDKYNPDQFEIIGLGISNSGIEFGVQPYKPEHKKYRKEVQKRGAVDGDLYLIVNGVVEVPYARIIIKHKKGSLKNEN